MINGLQVVSVEDYSNSESFNPGSGATIEIKLPKSDVLKYILEDGSWVCIRPSGTEPKCKFYFGVKGETEREANEKLSTLKHSILASVKV